MRLRTSAQESSIYETFSDLIFGTLVLFLVLVMGLALRVKDAQSEAQRTAIAAQLVYEGRFAGGADSTRVYISHVPVDGQLYVAWFPEVISSRWDLDWESGGGLTAPEMVCEYHLEYGDSILMSVEDFFKLGGGITWAFANSIYEDPRLGAALHLARRVTELEPGRAWTASSLADAIGGLRLQGDWRDLPDRPRALYFEEYLPWKRQEAGGSAYLLSRTKAPLRDALDDNGEPPSLAFTVLDGRAVLVGETEMSPMQIKANSQERQAGQRVLRRARRGER